MYIDLLFFIICEIFFFEYYIRLEVLVLKMMEIFILLVFGLLFELGIILVIVLML